MLALTLTVASLAFAQADSPDPTTTKPKEEVASGLQSENIRRAQYNEIERGFSFRLPVGVFSYLTPVTNTATNTKQTYNPGIMIGLELAYDITRWLDIGGFAY